MRCVSLLYHDVLDEKSQYPSSGFTGAGPDRYKLTSDLFLDHIEAMNPVFQKEYECFDLSVFQSGKGKKQAFYAITFDDGGKSFITTIAPLLEKFSLRGVFFISTKFIDTPNFLSRNEVKQLHERGHTIASHSHSHPRNISKLDEGEIEKEWAESCQILSDITNQKVNIASVPAGFYSDKVLRAASSAGIDVLFTSEPTSKVAFRKGVMVIGRYFLQDGDNSVKAQRIVRNTFTFRMKEYVFWNSKKIMKRLLGNTYFLLRNKLLTKSND